MDFGSVIADKFDAFSQGLASLAPYGATLSLTLIGLALVFAPAAKEWSSETRRYTGVVIFGLVVIGLVPAFVAAVGG